MQEKDRCGNNDDLKLVSNEHQNVMRAATAIEVQPIEGPGELPNNSSSLLKHRIDTGRRCIVRFNIVLSGVVNKSR